MTDPRASVREIAPRREIITPHPQRSIRTLVHDFPSDICGWAAHPEYEIHLIQHSTGTIIAGDHVGTFGPGHVSMMGPRLPHDWVSDIEPGEIVRDRDVVIQFTDEWLRGCMGLIPELMTLDPLLHASTRGLAFSGATGQRAGELALEIANTAGTEQIASLFELLALFANAPDGESMMLASEWFGTSNDVNENLAIEAGLAYIFDNLTGDIRLSKAAELAHMSESTFSKYFKRAAGTTFSGVVKRLRVANARRLLDGTDMSIGDVAYESGYHNLANFNRQFLEELGMTPRAYRKLDPADKPPATILSRGLKADDD